MKRARSIDALIAFSVTIAVLILFNFAIWYGPEGWTWVLVPSKDAINELGLQKLAWPWFPALGSIITLLCGSLLALRHR